jgi:hypothetical protein
MIEDAKMGEEISEAVLAFCFAISRPADEGGFLR